MPVSQPYAIACDGGLDTSASPFELIKRPGFAKELTNFEVDVSGGYRRINGFTAFGDVITLPDQYSNLITARARYYTWQFKESPQQAAFAMDDYKRGMRQMKSNLINPAPRDMTDDRTYF